MTRCAAIVVDYHAGSLLRCALESLVRCEQMARAQGIEVEIVVVDNSECGASNEHVAGLDVTVLAPPRNLGFAGGVEYALERTTCDHVALLNPDATACPQWIAESVDVLARSDDRTWAVCPRVVTEDGRLVQSLGVGVDRLGWAFDIGSGTDVRDLVGGVPGELVGPTGGALVADAAMWRSLGGLDREYFAFLEDVDLAWRAKAHGLRAAAVDLEVHHVGNATFAGRSSEKAWLIARNRWRLIARNGTAFQLPLLISGQLLHLVLATLYGTRNGTALATLRGHASGAAGFRRARRAVQRPCAVPLERPRLAWHVVRVVRGSGRNA